MTWDVASVTNLIIYADTLEGANIDVRPDKSERNLSVEEAQHSGSDQGDSIVSSTNVFSSKMYQWVLSVDADVCAVHSGRLMTSRTRMTKLPEPTMAEGNEDVTEKNCQRCRRE